MIWQVNELSAVQLMNPVSPALARKKIGVE
jgi:hypothetical protein